MQQLAKVTFRCAHCDEAYEWDVEMKSLYSEEIMPCACGRDSVMRVEWTPSVAVYRVDPEGAFVRQDEPVPTDDPAA